MKSKILIHKQWIYITFLDLINKVKLLKSKIFLPKNIFVLILDIIRFSVMSRASVSDWVWIIQINVNSINVIQLFKRLHVRITWKCCINIIIFLLKKEGIMGGKCKTTQCTNIWKAKICFEFGRHIIIENVSFALFWP